MDEMDMSLSTVRETVKVREAQHAAVHGSQSWTLLSDLLSLSLFSYFRMDWFDLLAVQGTLKNLLQHHSLKTSVL